MFTLALWNGIPRPHYKNYQCSCPPRCYTLNTVRNRPVSWSTFTECEGVAATTTKSQPAVRGCVVQRSFSPIGQDIMLTFIHHSSSSMFRAENLLSIFAGTFSASPAYGGLHCCDGRTIGPRREYHIKTQISALTCNRMVDHRLRAMQPTGVMQDHSRPRSQTCSLHVRLVWTCAVNHDAVTSQQLCKTVPVTKPNKRKNRRHS